MEVRSVLPNTKLRFLRGLGRRLRRIPHVSTLTGADGDSSRRAQVELCRIGLGFGVLIALLLVHLQAARLLLWSTQTADSYAAAVGAGFLLVGLLLGHRQRRAVLHLPGGIGADTVEQGSNEAGPPAPPTPASRPAESPLTPREREILRGVAEGCSNAELARRHFVSLNTVKTHLRQIHTKLEVQRRGQAVAKARTMGLLD